MEPEDAVHLADLFARLSSDSRYLRYGAPMPSLPDRLLRRLAAIDHGRHEAVGAFVEGELVGVAHSFRLAEDPSRADISVEVADEYQRRGVGARLLEALAEHAVRRGIRRFIAFALSENRAVRALVRHASWPVELYMDGAETTIELVLVPEPDVLVVPR